MKYLIKLNAIALDLTTTTAKQAFVMMKIEINSIIIVSLTKDNKKNH